MNNMYFELLFSIRFSKNKNIMYMYYVYLFFFQIFSSVYHKISIILNKQE